MGTELVIERVCCVLFSWIILVGELPFLKLPDHGRGFQVMMSAWLPDWEVRERGLAILRGQG
jgi:hypothetical protein